jgi:PAS domain S-box-containing protein
MPFMSHKSSISHSIIDIIPDMCFVLSEDMRIVDCNQTARELTGLSLHRNAEALFSSLFARDSSPPDPESIPLDGETARADARFEKPDGTVIEARLFMRRVREDDRTLIYVVGHDVSEAKQKDLDLLQFSNAVHYTVNPIQITDADGKMIYVNPAFERATGYSKEELIGNNPRMISSRKYSKEFWSKAWNTIRSGKVWNAEIENRRKDGRPLYTQVLISPILDSEGKVIGYLGSHRDVTEQKALEQQLMHSQKMESIGTLTAGIAHEVGNPLTSISSIVQVLLRTMTDEFARDKLSLVQSQVHRITKIIRDLVDFSRPSNYQIQPVDLVKILTDAVEIVKMGKKAKEVTFVTHVRHPVPLLSLVPDQMSQVFINILLNAVDALQGKRGTITTDFEMDDAHVRVSITDDGCGIDSENMPKIFEPFFTTKPVGEGTGLGLWVSYGIMKSFRGDITVESTRGGGTTFCVILPLNARELAHA